MFLQWQSSLGTILVNGINKIACFYEHLFWLLDTVLLTCMYINSSSQQIKYFFLPSLLTFLHTYLLTYLLYLLTPCSRVLLKKLSGFQLVKKFPAFYGNRRFTRAFTRACDVSLSWARLIESIRPTSYFLKIHLRIVLLSTPRSSKWSISLRLPHQNPVCTSPLPHMCYVPRPSHSSRFDHPNNIWWAVQISKLLIM
jgi:hypothetical protein